MKRYALNILIAIDQLINTLCGGDPDETISSRVGKRRNKAESFFARIVDTIFFWQKNHTERCIEKDEGTNSVV